MTRFEWDPDKAASNIVKHEVGFSEAARIFLDPLSWTREDRVVDGEQRWKTFGMMSGQRLLVVVHTDRYEGEIEVIHIISARNAERWEREEYEEEDGEFRA